VSRIALLALLSAGVAGCSSDFSRFDQFASKPPAPETTGSIARAQPAPTTRVETSALPPAQPSYGGGAGIGTYQPPQRPEYTGSVVQRQPEPPQYQQPQYQAPLAAAPHVSAPKTRVAAPVSAPPAPPSFAAAPHAGTHVVVPGETIYSLARHYKLTPMAIAKANNVGLDHHVKVGDRIVIPGGGAAPRTAQAAPAPVQQSQKRAEAPVQQPAQPRVAAKPATVAAAPTKQVAAAPVQKVATSEPAPAPAARMVTPAADPVADEKPTGTTGGSTSFRWPVRGKVITGFGPKPTGGQNDGINVSVPEGTAIKAAEDGVVAYAGNELKGYGNLVLVRHPNGFVTAYAHASELNVKKGEPVKRGQVIGKAGATGNVSGPQLHFEVRKGATPVDPMQYLSGG
jgi:murein DD-endopeptidase MepM/ murein hydrolase activator NlpD